MQKLLKRVPRIIATIYVIFMCRSTLSDFNGSKEIWIINCIVTILLIGILILSRKKQLAGGIIFTLIGLTYIYIYFFIFESNKETRIQSSSIQRRCVTAIPTLLAGILFIIDRGKEKKGKLFTL